MDRRPKTSRTTSAGTARQRGHPTDRGGTSDLYVMSPSGAGQVELASNGFDAVWSPNSRMLAFGRYTGNGPDIWRVDSDGTNEAVVIEPDRSAFPADWIYAEWHSWSSDSREIVYASNESNPAYGEV